MNQCQSNLLISVAIATCNGSRHIADQIQSVITQTYRPIEIVISDDCSDDDTVSIIRSFQDIIPITFMVNATRLGYARNFEQAILHCRGEFIALCDQDDVWLPDKLEQLHQAIGSHSLVFSDSVVVDEKLNVLQPSFRRYHRNIATDNATFLQLFFSKCIYGNTMLFHRSLIADAFPMPGASFKHDWWLPLVAVKRHGIVSVDKPLLLYRQHGSNAIGATEKPGAIRKFFRFIFSSKQRQKRQDRKRKFLNLIHEFKGIDLPLSSQEQDVLAATEYLFTCYTDRKITFRAMRIAWRNRSLYHSSTPHCIAELIAFLLFRS